MSGSNTDRSQTAPAQKPQDEVAQKLQRAAAVIAAKHGMDLNQAPPALEYDKGSGFRYFDTAPIPLKRLLGSPLVQSGQFAKGPKLERQLSGGWGDARNFSYDPKVNTGSIHMGLDFIAPFGEDVHACGDGIVTFVGFQERQGLKDLGAHDLEGAHQRGPKNWTIYDAKDQIAANPESVGYGGIIIFIVHNGDFEGYRTEYMHLSKIVVAEGSRVSEGQKIGEVGTSGLQGLLPHLHFQTALIAAGQHVLVRPTTLVPNYWPGHADSTQVATPGAVAPAIPLIGLLPSGAQVAINTAFTQLQGADRATIAQNQTLDQIKENQAKYDSSVADRLNAHQGGMYASVAAFQGAGITVSSPMTFDFDKGTWSDGQPI